MRLFASHRRPVAAWLMLAGLLPAAQPALAAGQCRQFDIRGEVRGKAAFFRPIGMGLSFRMQPSTDAGGWHFEIGPTHAAKGEFNQYVYAVNPPYRGRLVTMLDTEYATLAQDVVHGRPVGFWFLVNRHDAPRASAALEQVLWPDTDTAQDQGLAVLAALAKGQATLRILDSDIVPGTAKRGSVDPNAFYGAIKRLAFSVRFVVPKGFKPAAGLDTGPAACPDASHWLDE